MRLLLVPLFAFSVGWLAAAAVVSAVPCGPGPATAASIAALIGALASAIHLRRAHTWPTILALGFLVAIAWFCGARPHLEQPSAFAELVGEDREDMLVEATVIEGPRFWPDGATYTIAVTRIDGDRFDGEPLRMWVAADLGARPLWPQDEIEVFGRGSLYAPADFPGLDGPRERMARHGIEGRLIAREAPVVLASSWSVARASAQRRVRLERFVAHAAPASAPMITAMLTGSRGGLAERTWETFRDTGTAHVLAISGLHFGVLAALLWALGTVIARRSLWVCRHVGARRFSSAIVLAGLALYLLMVGAPVSAVRAWVALGVAVVALWALRRPSVFGALCVAAVALSAANPAIVCDLGFQLSFAATLGITIFWYRRPALLRRDRLAFDKPSRARALRNSVLAFIGISWAASAATTPILMGANGMISVAGPFVNLAVVPWVSVVIFPAIVAGAVAWTVFPPAGAVAFAAVDVVLAHTEHALELVAGAPWCVWTPGVGSPLLVAAMLLVVFTLLWRGLRPRDIAVATLLAAVFVIHAELRRHQPPPVMRLHFIPVGQGDATLIESPDGTRILIDAGGSQLGRDPGRHIVVPYLRRLGITHLHAVLVTHEDIDHSGGVPAVLELLHVDQVLRDPADLPVPTVHLARYTDTGSENERSVTTHIALHKASVLLTGDIEARSENAALDANRIPQALILKVPHHGSATSSTPDFLDTVQPRLAIISAGRHNRFGHPHPDVVRRYQERAIRLLSTAQNGLIIAEIDPHTGTVEVRTRR